MSDYNASIWLTDEARLEEAADLLAASLAANEAVIDSSATVGVDEEEPRNRWLSVSFRWDPAASARIANDFKLDELTDQACAEGLVATLSSAGLEVAEVFDEHG